MENSSIDIAKKIVAVLASIALVVIWYATSYRPLQKSDAYITVMNQNFTSLDDFLNGFDRVLEMPSPIGHEELVRNFGSIALNLINQYGKTNPEVVERVVAMVEKEFKPIIQNGTGMSYTQNLFVLAGANQSAFLQTRDPKYWAQAEKYYKEGIVVSPHRPQFLYGSFDLYRSVGNLPEALRIGEQILMIWPDDERMKQEVEKVRAGLLEAMTQESAP